MGFSKFKAITGSIMLVGHFATSSLSPVHAQENTPQNNPITTGQSTADIMQYAHTLHLAYIKSPDARTNDNAHKGLMAVAAGLVERTSVEPKDVIGLDIEKDSLLFFPFIYWPISEQTEELSAAAQKKVRDYLNKGGVILFDVRDQSINLAESSALRRILGNLAINPLTQMDKDHIVMKSHYLLSQFRGSSNGQNIWVEAPLSANSNNVSSVIISQENWSGAWRGLTHTKGSEGHKQAIRAGVNMVLYALTGNYKSDAIHVPTINFKRTPK